MEINNIAVQLTIIQTIAPCLALFYCDDKKDWAV